MIRKVEIVGFLIITVAIAVNCLNVNNEGIKISSGVVTPYNSTGNGSFVLGELTESSVLLKVYNISSPYSYAFAGLTVDTFQIITFVEGIDLNQNGTGGYMAYITGGGLLENYLYLWFQSNFDDGIDFLIRVYGEQIPNNSWSIGAITPNSDILFIRRVYITAAADQLVNTNVTFTYSGRPLITRIEATDLGGGRVVQVNWVTSQVTVFLESTSPGFGINFEIAIYGERDDQQDFQIGSLNENSVLLFRQRVTVPAGEENQHVSASVSVTNEPSHYNSLIQVFNIEETNGTGSIVELHEDGLNSQYLVLWLRSTTVGLGIDVWVNVYGDAWDTNFRVGEVTNKCNLLYTETIYSLLPPNALALIEYTNEDGAIITMVQGRDLSYTGTGGRLSSLTNGVGTNNVTILIDKYSANTWTFYAIDIYGY